MGAEDLSQIIVHRVVAVIDQHVRGAHLPESADSIRAVFARRAVPLPRNLARQSGGRLILERTYTGRNSSRRSPPTCRTSLILNRAAASSEVSAAACENSPRASSPTAIGAT